jgi:hypothetical protein
VNRRSPSIAGTLTVAIVGMAVGSVPDAEQRTTAAEDLLQVKLGLSTSELRQLRAGSAVAKSLESSVRQELAHIGVVRIQKRSDEFIGRFRDIERFERGPGIPQIGRFSTPPRLEDLASLTVPTDDVEALQECRPGDCALKLSAQAMQRLRAQVHWTSPAATQQANEAIRRMLLDLVVGYQTRGNGALGRYDDGTESLPVGDEFNAVLARPIVTPVPVPALLAYLRDFPNNRPQDSEEFFYWAVVEFGLKPTIRINHTVIQPLTGAPSAVAYAIATKQLYATHYFHTTLELRFLINDVSAQGHAFYLVSIVRSRNDGMTGFTGSLARPIISRRSRNGVRRYLEYVKSQMEH